MTLFRWIAVVGWCAALAMPAQAQSAGALEARLPSVMGSERARTLAQLVRALESDQPVRALAYGRDALVLLDALPDPATRAATLAEMGWAYMTMSRYDSAVAYAERGRDVAAAAGARAEEARALSNLGTIAQRRGDPDAAIALFGRALEIQRASGTLTDVATSLNNLGFVYGSDLAEYEHALELHAEALHIRERLGDSTAIALSLNNIGIVYERLRRADQALVFFERALAMRRALGLKARIAATLDNIGSLHMTRGDARKALAAHRESLAIRETIADPSAVAQAHRNVGLAYLALGRLAPARGEIAEAVRLGSAIEDKGLLARNLIALAAVERARGDAAAAERAAERALAIARTMATSRDLRLRAWEALSEAQAVAGRHAAALASFKRVRAVGDSIFDEATSRRVASLGRQVEQERREREVQLLRVEASYRTEQRNTLAIAAALMLVAGLVAYWRRVLRTRRAETLSTTDPLTGVRNRRYLEQIIAGEVAGSLRRHRSAAEQGSAPEDADLACLLLDIDHFKQVNDTYGHAVGDRLLVEMARALERVCRGSDVVVRWGGEEFLILGRFADRSHTAAHAERLRRVVERLAVPVGEAGGPTLRVTCSIGYAVFPLDVQHPEALSWDEIVRVADRALYAAKRGGRNQCSGHLAPGPALVAEPRPAAVAPALAVSA